MKKKRKPGYYWVKSFTGEWYIAQLIKPKKWVKMYDNASYSEENFNEIGDFPIVKGDAPNPYEVIGGLLLEIQSNRK